VGKAKPGRIPAKTGFSQEEIVSGALIPHQRNIYILCGYSYIEGIQSPRSDFFVSSEWFFTNAEKPGWYTG
jgi:hypothetical protein